MIGTIRALRTLWEDANDRLTGKAPKGAKRSSQWGKVRDAFLKKNPSCACCGGTKTLRVHHIVPFHEQPSLELVETNLITLCEAKKYGINCHLLLGHLGNWRRWNATVVFSAGWWGLKIKGKQS